MATVLVIDDHEAIRAALRIALSLEGITVLEAAEPESARAKVHMHGADIDVVIQDMNFHSDETSGEEGIALFHALRALQPDLPIILLTAWTHLEQAVLLVRAGAADYLQKPWEPIRLLQSLQNLIELSEQRRAAQSAQSMLVQQRAALAEIDLRGQVIHSLAMQELVRIAARVAQSQVSVLITGPNGAGKEGIAEILHYNSNVKDGPFISLNCGAIPAELIEAELFGADSGAYTGATHARAGRFEVAQGGSLLLDEIGNLSLAGQMKLLRVLETGQYERLGSNHTRHAQVRVISATNADLKTMISQGKFREDLYYRLNVIELRVPPLNARTEDILPIATALLGHAARLSPQAALTLRSYPWPGNVRELKNVLTRATLLAPVAAAGTQQIINSEDLRLPEHAQSAKKITSASTEPTHEEILGALKKYHGVIADAAQYLGLTRQSLYRRMDRFAIAREPAR